MTSRFIGESIQNLTQTVLWPHCLCDHDVKIWRKLSYDLIVCVTMMSKFDVNCCSTTDVKCLWDLSIQIGRELFFLTPKFVRCKVTDGDVMWSGYDANVCWVQSVRGWCKLLNDVDVCDEYKSMRLGCLTVCVKSGFVRCKAPLGCHIFVLGHERLKQQWQ